MIQNRITTVTCSQPSCSKWWCRGAIRKTRWPAWTRKTERNRPLARLTLKTLTCTMTESVITTNRPPRISSSSSVRVRIANPARAAPRAREPVSPMKIAAGEAFHHRKPKQAPVIAAAMIARSSGSRTS